MFQPQLEELVHRSQASAAALVGFDGIAADTFALKTSSVDILSVSQESAYIMNALLRSTTSLPMGSLQQASFSTELFHVLTQILDSNYFLVLLLPKTSMLGKARFFLEMAGNQLQGIIQHKNIEAA